MSGGRFYGHDVNLLYEMFGYGVNPRVGLNDNTDYKQDVKFVRKQNTFKDKMISEIVYDVMCLIHDYDYYVSGDYEEKTYKDTVKFFKKKWFKPFDEKRIREIVDEELANTKEELLEALLVGDDNGTRSNSPES